MTTLMCPLGFLGAHGVFLLLQLSDKLSDSMFETICDSLSGKHVAHSSYLTSSHSMVSFWLCCVLLMRMFAPVWGRYQKNLQTPAGYT
jgi:hypothetical protein